MSDAQTTWGRIEQAELGVEGVTPGTGFGGSAAGLRIHGKIYAISKGSELILKELIDSGTGSAWGPGTGRIMREWVAIADTYRTHWAPLTEEARTFVGGRR
jgi:hypothetical protein